MATRFVSILCFLFFVSCGSTKSPKPTDDGNRKLDQEQEKESEDEGSSTGNQTDPSNPTELDRDDAPALFGEDQVIYSKDRQFAVKAEWIDGPRVGYCKVRIRVMNPELTEYVEAEDFDFLPYMSIHGHPGAIKKMKVNKEALGQYYAEDFYLTMTGPWELFIDVKIAGKSDRATVEFEVKQ